MHPACSAPQVNPANPLGIGGAEIKEMIAGVQHTVNRINRVLDASKNNRLVKKFFEPKLVRDQAVAPPAAALFLSLSCVLLFFFLRFFVFGGDDVTWRSHVTVPLRSGPAAKRKSRPSYLAAVATSKPSPTWRKGGAATLPLPSCAYCVQCRRHLFAPFVMMCLLVGVRIAPVA